MERRIYFICGDLVTNAVLAAIATFAAYLLPSTWPMLVEMIVGMVTGMLVAMVVMPLFMFFFGAMEVMLPVMLGSMLSSMLPGMLPHMRGELGLLLLWGAGIGVATWAFTYLLDFFAHGEKRYG